MGSFGTRTAVVMLWVSSGRRASLVWYLALRGLVSDWGNWRNTEKSKEK